MSAKRIRKVALYVRVSTDHQTIKNQTQELEAVAERHGWSVVAVFKDQGIFQVPRAAMAVPASTS